MAVTQYWSHFNLPADQSGFVVLQSPNPFGTHALSGAAWVGGATNIANSTDNSMGNPYQDGWAPAPIVLQFAQYDPATDTTYWTAIFRFAPGATIRAHVGGFVTTP